MALCATYVILQDCAHQNTVAFKRFDDLPIGSWYLIEKFILIHSPFGVKLAVRVKNKVEYGGCFIINLPDRFKLMAEQGKIDELNAEEDMGYMHYGGKDYARKNHILISFEKHLHNSELLAKDEAAQESIDDPY